MNKEEIKYFRKKHNLKQGDLAEIANASLRSVQNWEGGVRNMSKNTALLLSEWEKKQPNEGSYRMEISPSKHTQFMEVEYVPISVLAGRLSGHHDCDAHERDLRVLPKEPESEKYLVVDVEGDSMDDNTRRSICDGDEILIKEHVIHNGDKLPIRDNLFIIVSAEGTVIKQITEHNTDKGYIKCHSFNPLYEDFIINLKEVYFLYLFKKIVGRKPTF